MIRIAICDNDIQDLEAITKSIHTHMQKQSEDEFFIRRFQSVYDLMECLENPNQYFNIYFLNVVMPICTGIEVGRMIRKNDELAVIIYTTTTPEYAMDAFSTAPLQYLMKPIVPEQLFRVLDSACDKVQQGVGRSVLIKRKEGLANIPLRRIEYIEYRDHALDFHLYDGQVIPSRIIRKSFSWIAENSLNDARFIKPHASYIVNMDYVRALGEKGFEMESGVCVPISKRIYSQVKQCFIAYTTMQNGVSLLGI